MLKGSAVHALRGAGKVYGLPRVSRGYRVSGAAEGCLLMAWRVSF